MNRITSLALAFASVFMCSWSSADTLYETDFSTFADGMLEGQDGWNAQPLWEVAGGMTTNTGSWQRAKQAGAPFTMQPGDVVRMTVEFSLTGDATNTEVARFGFAKSNETPGQNTPQVFAGVNWNGTELSIGGATDDAYDSGDVIRAALTFTMLSDTNAWLATSRCENLTDGTSFEAGFSPGDSAGDMSPETAWEWLNGGSDAQFSFRTMNNTTAATMAVNNILLENNLPPDEPIAEVIYDVNFCDLATAPLGGQDGWEGQPDWVVTGGMANANGSWTRARQLSPLTMTVGDQIRVTAEMSFSGKAGGTDFFSLGMAKNNEDTGANMPQVEGIANWSGTTLSFGGATDTGYDSGDTILVTMLFTREATLNSWTLDTTLENLTDATTFSGTTAPVDDPGSTSPETLWEWLDTGDTGFFGMRMLDNPTETVAAMKTLLIEKNPPGDGEVLKGDVNLDGVVNLLDVASFVELLSDNTFQAEADCNCDGVLNLLDVQPFVSLLGG